MTYHEVIQIVSEERFAEIIKDYLKKNTYVGVGVLAEGEIRIIQTNEENTREALEKLGINIKTLEGLINESIKKRKKETNNFTSVGINRGRIENKIIYKTRLTFYGKGIHSLKLIRIGDELETRLSYSNQEITQRYFNIAKRYREPVNKNMLKRIHTVVQILNQ